MALCVRSSPQPQRQSPAYNTALYGVVRKGRDNNALSQQDLSGIDPAAQDSYRRTAKQCFSTLRPVVEAKTMEAFQRLTIAASRH